jgi:hypothetical protein
MARPRSVARSNAGTPSMLLQTDEIERMKEELKQSRINEDLTREKNAQLLSKEKVLVSEKLKLEQEVQVLKLEKFKSEQIAGEVDALRHQMREGDNWKSEKDRMVKELQALRKEKESLRQQLKSEKSQRLVLAASLEQVQKELHDATSTANNNRSSILSSVPSVPERRPTMLDSETIQIFAHEQEEDEDDLFIETPAVVVTRTTSFIDVEQRGSARKNSLEETEEIEEEDEGKVSDAKGANLWGQNDPFPAEDNEDAKLFSAAHLFQDQPDDIHKPFAQQHQPLHAQHVQPIAHVQPQHAPHVLPYKTQTPQVQQHTQYGQQNQTHVPHVQQTHVQQHTPHVHPNNTPQVQQHSPHVQPQLAPQIQQQHASKVQSQNTPQMAPQVQQPPHMQYQNTPQFQQHAYPQQTPQPQSPFTASGAPLNNAGLPPQHQQAHSWNQTAQESHQWGQQPSQTPSSQSLPPSHSLLRNNLPSRSSVPPPSQPPPQNINPAPSQPMHPAFGAGRSQSGRSSPFPQQAPIPQNLPQHAQNANQTPFSHPQQPAQNLPQHAQNANQTPFNQPQPQAQHHQQYQQNYQFPAQQQTAQPHHIPQLAQSARQVPPPAHSGMYPSGQHRY